MSTFYEAPESVKYHGGYDPSDPPQGKHYCYECSNWDDDCECQFCEVCGKRVDPHRDSGAHEACDKLALDKVESACQWFDELSAQRDKAGDEDVCAPASSPVPLQLDYPAWRLGFFEYGLIDPESLDYSRGVEIIKTEDGKLHFRQQKP